MNVVAFPEPAPLDTPNLELLGYVFAALIRLGEPATAQEIAEMIIESGVDAMPDAVLSQTKAIMTFYSRTPLTTPVKGHVFRQMAGTFAFTVDFRAHLLSQGFTIALRSRPMPGACFEPHRLQPRRQGPAPTGA